MRFGCCTNMVASRIDKTGIEYLEILDQIGYDYVELPLAELMSFDEEKLWKLKEQIDRLSIECEVCNNFFPENIKITGLEFDMEKVLAYADQALNRAKILGAACIVFGSGAAKNIPEGISWSQGYNQFKNVLYEIAKLALEKDITICIEPLRRQECNLINTFEEGCKLAYEIGHPSIKMLVDYYHMSAEKEPIDHIRKLGRNYLKHVHFSSPKRSFPKDDYEDAYFRFFRVLKEIGYDCRISCEAYSDNFRKEATETLKFLKQMDVVVKGGDVNV